MITNFNIKYPPIKSRLETKSETSYNLVVEPLLPGFGYTIGNSLRRVLLSSIPGFSVTKITINDLTHEYQPVAGVKEDALDIVLNLKRLRVKIVTDEDRATLTLRKIKGGDVLAKDFEKNSSVEVINPDLYICSLGGDSELTIELEIRRGVGYVSLENLDLAGNTDPKGILVDAIFTPVSNVALDIEQVRVGDKTNFDRINISFDTDGTVSGKEVADFALKLVVDIFTNIYSSFQSGSSLQSVTAQEEAVEVDAVINDEIDLPPRIKKILEKNNITTNSELKARAGEVAEFAGVAAKTVEAIEEYLKGL